MTALRWACMALLAGTLPGHVAVSVSAQKPAAERPRLVAQVGHGHANALAFSPDGAWLAAAESDGVRLWDVATRREIRRYTVADPPVSTAVVFTPDGRTLVAGGSRSEISLWNTASGVHLKTVMQSKEDRIAAITVAPDGSRLAAGDASGQICLWSLPQLARERCMRLDAGRVSSTGMSLRFAGDGATVGAMQEKRLRVWEVRTGKVLTDSGSKSPDGSEWWFLGMSRVDPIALTGRGEIVDLATGDVVGGFGRVASASAVAFGPARRHALIASAEGALTIVDLASGDRRRTEIDCGACGFRRAIDAAAISPDGRTAVTASKDDVLRMWDVETLELRGTFESMLMPASSVEFSPDGNQLLVATRTGAIVWSLAEGREAARLPYPFAQDNANASFSASGRYAITMADGEVTLWDTAEWRPLRSFRHRPSVDDLFRNWRAAISDDETLLLTADRSTINLFRVPTGERVREFTVPPTMEISTAVFRPDGSEVVIALFRRALAQSAGPPAETHVWDVATGESRRLSQDAEATWSVLFLNDGRTATTGGGGQPLRFRDAQTWAEIKNPLAGVMRGSPLAASRDANRILIAGGGTAAIWDRQAAKPIRSYAGLYSVADLSPDGRWLVGRVGEALHAWNVESSDAPALIYSFADGSWAVTDEAGRYDTGDPNRSPGLHWVLGSEVIELGQLKTQFYTRGLLARSLQGKRLLDVGGGIGALAPRPLVTVRPVDAGARELHVTLIDAGGGLGPVTVLVNGKPLPEQVAPPTPYPTGPVELTIPLTGAVWLPGVENDIEVVVENAVDRVPARPRGVKVVAAAGDSSPPPSFHALVVGTGEFPFSSGALNLKFPAQDARAMATALRIGASRLVGADRVHIRVLESDAADPARQPTKANIVRDLGEIAKAAGGRDTVLVFFAGHGVTHGREYLYLTQDATSADLSNAAVRAARAFGSSELEHWLRAEIRALKYVVILDTCAAGAAAQALAGLALARESDDDVQVRAVAQLKAATGSFVLMGSAADKVSYEASQYGQGLLTYALLQAMRGELALQDGNYLMAADWLTYAVRRVRDLAHDIGIVQEPELSAPAASKNFQVARLNDDDKLSIPVAQPRPQVLRVICVDENDADPDGLEPLIRARLRGLVQAGSAAIVYLDTVVSELPGGFIPRVRYQRTEAGWRATVRVLRNNKVEQTEQITLSGDAAAIAVQMADAIVRAVTTVSARGGT